MSIINDALDLINTHSYKICEQCKSASKDKRNCTEYCLPVEMFVQMLDEDNNIRLEMMDNIKDLFEDETLQS